MIAAGSPRTDENGAIARPASRERCVSQQEDGHSEEEIAVVRESDRACDQRAALIRS